VLGLESVKSFTAKHFQAIAGIKSLKTLTVDSRKQPANEDAIAAFKQARPDVQVAVSQPGDKGPPQVKKK
jgi:cystathionine beta-lyase/cystathionine gamma-synthase